MTHKIMVVDDNSTTRRMVRTALQRNGHDVVEAPDGKTARELMRSERPRVVIQDLMLPDADGFALVGELRDIARGQDVSILLFSGFVSQIDEARASSVGFDDIIPKPIAPAHLVPLVEAHLPAAPMTGSARFGERRRLVIADDDPMQLKLATFRLSRLGFDIEAVPDGRAALDAARRQPPDIIVSDVMMPELDGFGLCMAVRQDPELRRVPVVLITSSYVETADRDLARRAGATDLVPRTPDLAELTGVLRDALGTTLVIEPVIEAEPLAELEREHTQRVFRQLERQVLLNSGLAKRCSALASELTVLTGISEAVLARGEVEGALDEALADCFDAGGISLGALYLLDAKGGLRVRAIGSSTGTTLGVDLESFFGHERLLRELIVERRTLLLPSMDVAPTLQDSLLTAARASGMLLVPVVHLDQAFGSLLMIARGRELDRDDWRAFAHGVATQISHVLALARAFADREAAERRATSHAAVLDALLENAPDSVAHLGLDGTIEFVNRTFGRTDPNAVVGAKIYDHVTPEHAVALRRAIEAVKRTGEPQSVDGSTVLPDGRTRWYSSRLGAIRHDDEVTGIVMVTRDITEAKQTEMHLMVADRMASVGTLAAGVAHEINNPLASVIANLDMALQDITLIAQPPPDLKDELEDARIAADRVREIVRDLKIFSRAEEGERRGAVDIEHVLDSTIRMAWNELRHRARIVKRYGRVPHVEANESRLGQVFLNLIVNAAHAIPPGQYDSHQITVTTAREGNRVVIKIADTGAGIPPEVRPRLFTPFFTTKPVGVGTGLGLAISHKIVHQFDGTITFDTELGKGTEFRVSFPIAHEATQPIRDRAPTHAPAARRGRILIVDDEEALGHAIRRFLSNEHDVTAVTSGGHALELLRGGSRYDVILCDLMMPQITGMDLHAEIAGLDAEQANRMVFVTGGAFTPSAREFLDDVENLRLDKPFDLRELRKLVNELIN